MILKRIGSSIDRNLASLIWPLHHTITPLYWPACPYQKAHALAVARASPDSPTIILVHGVKAPRVSMLPWARVLYAANFTALLYDSCGCGASAGWRIGVGASAPDVNVGATRALLGYGWDTAAIPQPDQ